MTDSGYGQWSVVPVSLRTFTARAPITLGQRDDGKALTPDGKKLYVFHQDTGTVTPIRTATRTILPEIKAGTPIKFISAPIAIAFGR